MNARIGSLCRELMLRTDSPFYSKGYVRVMEILLTNAPPNQCEHLIAPCLVGIVDDNVEYIVNFVIFMELELRSRIGQLSDETTRHELREKISALMSIPSDCKGPVKSTLENECDKIRTWSLEDQKRFFSTRMCNYIRISAEITLALLDE
jgi:hypothetical protein